MAVIGDEVIVSVFSLIGADGFKILRDEDVPKIIEDILSKGEYSIIVLPERYVDLTRDLREKLRSEEAISAIFAFIPEKTLEKRSEELKSLIGQAMGTKLKI